MEKELKKNDPDKVSSPDKLDDYIRVTTPSVWIILGALLLLLVGAIIWGVFGELTIHNEDGQTETVAPITFIIS